MAEENKNNILFLFYGDLLASPGTNTYIHNYIRYLKRSEGLLECWLFQVRPPAAHEQRYHNIDLNLRFALHQVPPAGWLRTLYRVIELVAVLRYILFRLPSCRRRFRGVFLSGEILLPLVWLLRQVGLPVVFVKLGIIEEFKLSRSGTARLKYLLLSVFEYLFLRSCGGVSVVSNPMAVYLNSRHAVANSRFEVLPCCVDAKAMRPRPQARERIRQALGWTGRLVCVYCGNAAPWQCVAETIACFRLIQRIQPNAALLILSQDGNEFQPHLASLELDAYRLKAVPHAEVADYLYSCDLAFLLRRRHIVNRVASPLKFAEYLACGLPVLIGPEVGDYSSLVVRHELGLVLDPDRPAQWGAPLEAFIGQLQSAPESIRRACIRIAQVRLTWHRQEDALRRLWSNVF